MQILPNGTRQRGVNGTYRSVPQGDEYGFDQNYRAQQGARRNAAKSRNPTSEQRELNIITHH